MRIAAAAAGGAYSLALTDDGVVFSWGGDYAGQSGLGQGGEDTALPQKVEALSGLNVCDVATGYQTSCAVTAAGELYTWGHGIMDYSGTVTQRTSLRRSV